MIKFRQLTESMNKFRPKPKNNRNLVFKFRPKPKVCRNNILTTFGAETETEFRSASTVMHAYTLDILLSLILVRPDAEGHGQAGVNTMDPSAGPPAVGTGRNGSEGLSGMRRRRNFNIGLG